jgi:hypothetical protein
MQFLYFANDIRSFVAYGHQSVLLYESTYLVPIARGQHLFPCRTQQLSLGAVTILGVHPWENSTVPNYD